MLPRNVRRRVGIGSDHDAIIAVEEDGLAIWSEYARDMPLLESGSHLFSIGGRDGPVYYRPDVERR